MAQGGVFTDNTGAPFTVHFRGTEVKLGSDLAFLIGTQLHGLTQKTAHATLMNTRITDILITATANNRVLFRQAQASFVAVMAKNGGISFRKDGELVQVDASAPMNESPIRLNGLILGYLYQLPGSGPGSVVNIDELGQVDTSHIGSPVSTTIEFP